MSRPHARPAALAVDASGTIVYVALSTADRLMALDVSAGHPPRVLWERPICAHPTALAALPGRVSEPEVPRGVLVSCRFEPELRLVTPMSTGRAESGAAGGAFEVRAVPAGPTHGHRGLAVDPSGRHAYVASAALGGVEVVDLPAAGRHPGSAGAPTLPAPETSSADALRFRATGLEPTVVRVVSVPGQGSPLLVVANRVSHTVTVHRLAPDGSVSEAIQTIRTEAPVLDLAVAAGAMYLLTYEDRPITRARRDIEGLDSVVLVLPPASAGGAPSPFGDPGLGRRRTLDLSEWPGAPVVDPEAAALWSDAVTGAVHLAVVGAGTDNLWISGDLAAGLGAPSDVPPDLPATAALDTEPVTATRPAVVIPVGTNPSAVVVLPDGRLVTADRLSDTVSVIDPVEAGGGGVGGSPGRGAAARAVTLAVGDLARSTPAELGEVLFYSRALVPNNTAAGALSLYTCASCHVDGHVDGRRHPSKFDRFASMTKSCRGLAGTEPFLSLGRPATLAAFADNIINTHAQGSDRSPATFDRYDVALRLPAAGARAADVVTWTDRPVGAAALRAALASYLAEIPLEPSPFVAPGRSALTPPERRGLRTFRLGCAGCHRLVSSTDARRPISPEAALERALLQGRVALTAAGRFDVGTPVLGAGGNNPPSLHGVWSAAPYFSDGSAASLEEVLARTDPGAPRIHAASNTRPGRPPAFSPSERADLLAFLRAL